MLAVVAGCTDTGRTPDGRSPDGRSSDFIFCPMLQIALDRQQQQQQQQHQHQQQQTCVLFCRLCSWFASTFRVCSYSVFTACAMRLCARSGRPCCPESRRTRPTLRTATDRVPLGIPSLYSRPIANSVIESYRRKSLAYNCVQIYETVWLPLV